MDGLKLEDRLQINALIWFQSLAEDEAGPSNRMIEELEALALKDGFPVERLLIGTRLEAINALSKIAQRADSGFSPIIHFDCHGSKNRGLFLQPSGEFLSWQELADALRPINVATGNSLCCIFGVCFGLHLSFQLRLSKPAPYFLTIAPEKEISVGVLEARTANFYRRLYETGNITQAYADILAPDLHLFYSRAVFAEALAIYVNNHCQGKRGAVRRERLLTELFQSRGICSPTKEQLKDARKQIKEGVIPTQGLIDRLAPTFLVGREPGFGIAELQLLAKGKSRRKHYNTKTPI